MALDKTSKNYCYNVGRTVAIVEIMNGLQSTFAAQVHDNAAAKLPYQLREALKNAQHNIHAELVEPADIALNVGDLPTKDMGSIDKTGSYWIGYYHEKAYLSEHYKGVFGKEEVTIEHHTPERVSFDDTTDNTINELKR